MTKDEEVKVCVSTSWARAQRGKKVDESYEDLTRLLVADHGEGPFTEEQMEGFLENWLTACRLIEIGLLEPVDDTISIFSPDCAWRLVSPP